MPESISAIFLDREGVLTPKFGAGEFLLRIEDVRLADGIIAG